MLWKQNLISFLLVLHHTEKYKSHYCASARVNVSSLSDTNQTVLTFSAALLWTSYSPQFRLFTWKRVFLKVKISSLGFFALSLTKTAFWGHGKTKAKKFWTIFENVNKKNSVNSKKKHKVYLWYIPFTNRFLNVPHLFPQGWHFHRELFESFLILAINIICIITCLTWFVVFFLARTFGLFPSFLWKWTPKTALFLFSVVEISAHPT